MSMISRTAFKARCPVASRRRGKLSCRPCAAVIHDPSKVVQSKDVTTTRTWQPRLLSLMSENIAWEAQLSIFESLAGRSAMLGFVVAAFLEVYSQEALFPSASIDSLLQLVGGCVALATVVALLMRQTIGDGLRDSVLSSLTAVKRSAASVTVTANLDEALDKVVSRTFDSHWTAMLAVADMLDEDFP